MTFTALLSPLAGEIALAFYCYDYFNLGQEGAEKFKNDSTSLKESSLKVRKVSSAQQLSRVLSLWFEIDHMISRMTKLASRSYFENRERLLFYL